MPSSAVKVDPLLGFWGSHIGHFFFLVDRQSAVLWLQNSKPGRLVGQECEDGIWKTKTRVRLLASGMAVTISSG